MHPFASQLISVLHAEKPAPERFDKLQLYGRFIGDWETEIIAHAPDGARHEASGEIHFGWILEGRAIQDVWMIPRLAERPNAPPFPIAGNWYGTTIRVYDPNIDAWRIYWIDPARNIFQQAGRAGPISCRRVRPNRAHGRDGALPGSRRTHFTGWGRCAPVATAHGD
jgi:hypothetical protein